MSKKDSEALRVERVRQEYLAQVPSEKRTETLVLGFHGWLEENRPDLLWKGPRDTYQHLKSDLRGLYRSYK